jgi:hypothetical protein
MRVCAGPKDFVKRARVPNTVSIPKSGLSSLITPATSTREGARRSRSESKESTRWPIGLRTFKQAITQPSLRSETGQETHCRAGDRGGACPFQHAPPDRAADSLQLWFYLRVTQPLNHLRQTIESIGKGDLNATIRPVMTASGPDNRACRCLCRPGGGCRTRSSYGSRLAALRSDTDSSAPSSCAAGRPSEP